MYLTSWTSKRVVLGSHQVAAASGPAAQEVAGYVNYNIGMEPQVVWRVELEEGQVMRIGEQGVLLHHTTTDALLGVTEHVYPEPWGEGMVEVVGRMGGRGAGSTWRVEDFRFPPMVDYLSEEQREELYGGGTSSTTTSASQTRNNSVSSMDDLKRLLQVMDLDDEQCACGDSGDLCGVCMVHVWYTCPSDGEVTPSPAGHPPAAGDEGAGGGRPLCHFHSEH